MFLSGILRLSSWMTASSEATWLMSGWADTVSWRAGASFVHLSRSSAKGKGCSFYTDGFCWVTLGKCPSFEDARITTDVFCLIPACLTLQSGIFPPAHRRSRLHRGGLRGQCGADRFLRSYWKELCHSECGDMHGHKWMPTLLFEQDSE